MADQVLPPRPVVFVFIHDEEGHAVGAGSLEYADDTHAWVKPGGIGFTRLVPLAQISDFPGHPGYKRLGGC